MITKHEFLERAQVDRETLEVWIAEEWLVPVNGPADPVFSDADVSRAALIRDLKEEFGVNEQGVGIILNLLDQIHGLRSALATVLSTARARSTRD